MGNVVSACFGLTASCLGFDASADDQGQGVSQQRPTAMVAPPVSLSHSTTSNREFESSPHSRTEKEMPCSNLSTLEVQTSLISDSDLNGGVHYDTQSKCNSLQRPKLTTAIGLGIGSTGDIQDDIMNNPASEPASSRGCKEDDMVAEASECEQSHLNHDKVDAKYPVTASAVQMPRSDPLIGYRCAGRYEILSLLGEGGYAKVYAAKDIKMSAVVAVKVQPVGDESLLQERIVYRKLSAKGNSTGFAKVRKFVTEGQHLFLVMDLLGPSVYSTWKDKVMPLGLAAHLCWQILYRLEALHDCGVVHCDLKPENMLCGRQNPQVLHLVDFGVSQTVEDVLTKKKFAKHEFEVFVGTSMFAPPTAHEAVSQCRRDDLESLGYVILSLMGTKLPWEGKGMTEEDIWETVGALKRETSAEGLCAGGPPQMVEYFHHVRELDYDDIPDYEMLRGLMKAMAAQKNRSCTQLAFVANDERLWTLTLVSSVIQQP